MGQVTFPPLISVCAFFLLFLCRLCPALLDVLWTCIAGSKYSGHLLWIYFADNIYMCGDFFFCNIGDRLKLAVCRREGKISTISNNNSYLQAQGPQQVSLSFPVIHSYLRSEYHSHFVPVTQPNSFKQRKWNMYLFMAKIQGNSKDAEWNSPGNGPEHGGQLFTLGKEWCALFCDQK